MRFTDVVKRQHHQRQKQDRGDGGDPVSMANQNSILVRGGGVAHHLERAEIRRDETQPCDPGGHLPAGHEEFVARRGKAPQIDAQSEHQNEIEKDDEEVRPAERHQTGIYGQQARQGSWWHQFVFPWGWRSGSSAWSIAASVNSLSLTLRCRLQCSTCSTLLPTGTFVRGPSVSISRNSLFVKVSNEQPKSG